MVEGLEKVRLHPGPSDQLGGNTQCACLSERRDLGSEIVGVVVEDDRATRMSNQRPVHRSWEGSLVAAASESESAESGDARVHCQRNHQKKTRGHDQSEGEQVLDEDLAVAPLPGIKRLRL